MSTKQQNGSVTTPDELVSEGDYMQLCRLVIEHVWRTDHGHADTVHELYVDDGELTTGPVPLRGRAAIHEWGQQIVAAPPWRNIRHVVSNMRFVSDGADAAIGVSMLTVFMDADGTQSSVPWNVGEDHDRFVRTDQGWRFVSRNWVNLFTRGDIISIP